MTDFENLGWWSEDDTGDDLVTRALDPNDDDIQLVAASGRRPSEPIRNGDIVVAREPGGPTNSMVVVQPPQAGVAVVDPIVPLAAAAILARPRRRPIRIQRRDGLTRTGHTVVRRRGAREDFAETDVDRPTIRQGSRGSAVSEAQTRLNGVHTRRLAAGERGLDKCPLAVDGIFGSLTRAATVSFQRIAFPNDPGEWDGIIGPHTWTALISDESQVVVPGRLDPTRWEAILRPFAVGRVNLRTGNAVRALIDGNDTFNQMAADMGATRGEHDYIYLLGWDNFDDFGLGAASTFRAIYTAAASRGVEVAAMLWDQPFLNWQAHLNATAIVARINRLPGGKAIEDDLTTNNTAASTARLLAALAAARLRPTLIPVIIRLIEPDIARLGGSHHQKVLIVKRGQTLVAYCGGIDMNPNRINVVDPGTGQPHHDTHCRILGPSAFDVLSTFLSRWRHHPDSSRFGALRGESEPVPSPIARPAHNDAPFGGPVSVLIGRTFNPIPSRRSPPSVVAERSIKPVLLAAIGAARRFIYCEDQYLVDLDTANALAAAIPRLTHVTILIPGNPITDMPFGKEYRRDFVERVLSRLSTTDRAKFGVFQLSTSSTSPVFGDHTYVHSKSWVFDDELAVIGTANCNRRSYTFDSEVNAFIFDTARPTGQTFAQQYRMSLWQHHLTEPGSALVDGAASGALWRAGRRRSSAHVVEFNHRLATGPGTAGLRQRVMDVASDHLRDVIDPVP